MIANPSGCDYFCRPLFRFGFLPSGVFNAVAGFFRQNRSELMQDFQKRIVALDLSLFKAIPSQTSDDDRTSLLAVQSAVRSRLDSYTYLEIGSYHGGSIQPHLLDSKCQRIYSIDKRPDKQYDERGTAFGYKEGFTQVMIEKLTAVCPENIGKVKTFDMDASELVVADFPETPDYIFIDGEHTDKAVVSDFNAVLPLIKGPCVVGFHDAHIVFRGISNIIAGLERAGTPFKAYALPNCIFVIELGGFDIHKDPVIVNQLVDNHKAYLPSMNSMFKYRKYCNQPLGKLYVWLHKKLYKGYSQTVRQVLHQEE
jgi:Methyltransferase domain